MQLGISTHIFLPQRLTTSLLDTLAASGVQAIEVFASRHHFDYTDRAAVKELAAWFASQAVTATMHMPIFTEEEEANWSRHTAPTLNLIDASKNARIEAMDEVKRALEAAEMVPFQSCVLHLGLRDTQWDTRAIDDSLTAIEHLKAFAGPLGMKLLLENLVNHVATPAHLAEIVRIGHFQTVGFCLDTGHANLAEGVAETMDGPARSGLELAFADFGEGVRELHLHDNHGGLTQSGGGAGKDEHLWPGDGTIDWAAVKKAVAAVKEPPVGMLEIGYDLGYDTAAVVERVKRAAESLAAGV